MFSGDVKDIYELQLQVLGFELDLDARCFFPFPASFNSSFLAETIVLQQLPQEP